MLSITQISITKSRLLQFPVGIVNRYLERCYFRQHGLRENDRIKEDPRFTALRNKILYCQYFDSEKMKYGDANHKIRQLQLRIYERKAKMRSLAHDPSYSVLLNNASNESEDPFYEDSDGENGYEDEGESKPIHMPYARVDRYETTESPLDGNMERTGALLNERYKVLYEKYLEAKKATSKSKDQIDINDYIGNNDVSKHARGELWKVPENWMTDYELFDDTMLTSDWSKNQGTPIPDSEVSTIPCGGCGALLHCKDPELPGYLPSEIFLQGDKEDLKNATCQRCHFLKFYNAAVDVKVSIDDYPKLLQVLKKQKCAIVLMVDVTDFPCSIWPDLQTILHPQSKIFLVGNKVDLLPRDTYYCLKHVQHELLRTVLDVTNITEEIISSVMLISAKTGYGIEYLISNLQEKWGVKGDVYLVGCTNVGKSSLFNTLLNSDYCKVQAMGRVQSATISPWPGTTLNLLKFPILRPSRERLALRSKRLFEEKKFDKLQDKHRTEKFLDTGDLEFVTLQGHIGNTFSNRSADHVETNAFSAGSHLNNTRKLSLDENHPDFQRGRWFFDTPGTMQSDQILDLLTTDELVKTLPKRLISPRTFVFQKGYTMFLAGLGRLDHIEGNEIWCTLFASYLLPITICYTDAADEVYGELLKTKAFVVPENNPERLKSWPTLESKEFDVTGIHAYESAADIVLSSPGWVAITPKKDERVTLKAWTPQGRGIYLRSPAILRKSVALRGRRVPNTPMFKFGQQVYLR